MKTKEEILKMSEIQLKEEFKKLEINSCKNCHYCTDCLGCKDCIDLTGQQYMILNVQFTEEEYEKKLKKLKKTK